jgi:hypothetical protein
MRARSVQRRLRLTPSGGARAHDADARAVRARAPDRRTPPVTPAALRDCARRRRPENFCRHDQPSRSRHVVTSAERIRRWGASLREGAAARPQRSLVSGVAAPADMLVGKAGAAGLAAEGPRRCGPGARRHVSSSPSLAAASAQPKPSSTVPHTRSRVPSRVAPRGNTRAPADVPLIRRGPLRGANHGQAIPQRRTTHRSAIFPWLVTRCT